MILNKACKVYKNLTVPELVEHSIVKKEGILCQNGALVVDTGKYTGRSPQDRFIVFQESIKDKVFWGKRNFPVEEETYEKLYNRIEDYLSGKPVYVFDGFLGKKKEYRMGIRVICEEASSAMFANQLLVRPEKDELLNFKEDFTLIAAPSVKANGKDDGVNSEAFIIINFDKKVIIIGGTGYKGEIKKSLFSAMNFLLPEKGVLPMHCSANMGYDGRTTLFFGLSGTGKTTLSADPERRLIGDDEHGWADDGIFNFEGGCYAKVIDLKKENEEEIYDAIKFGTLLENVVLDSDRNCIYSDHSRTENTRAAYPIGFIKNVVESGIGSNPDTILFLSADAFGVLPPVSKLSREAAMYHFMSGFTSKVAGTERGIIEPESTFSACFGEPFMLRDPLVYAHLLGEKIDKNNTDVYLLNTGWIGGGYGTGSRIKLSYTRAIVDAVISGKLKNVEYVEHPVLRLKMPKYCPGVPEELLNPRNTWDDKSMYDKKVLELAAKFKENFKRFKDVPDSIINAGPV